MTEQLDVIERVRSYLHDSGLSDSAIQLAQVQLDSAATAAKSTNGNTMAAILGLSVMNTATLVTHSIDAAKRVAETRDIVKTEIKNHMSACAITLAGMPKPRRNSGPILQWSLGDAFNWFRLSPAIHYVLAPMLGVIVLWATRTTQAPTAAVAATAQTAAVAAVASDNALANPNLLKLLAGQIAAALLRDLPTNTLVNAVHPKS